MKRTFSHNFCITILTALCAIFIICLGAIAWRKPSALPKIPTSSKPCQTAYEPLRPVSSTPAFHHIANDSAVIVIGDIHFPGVQRSPEGELDFPPSQLRVTEVIKGAPIVQPGDILLLCSTENVTAQLKTDLRAVVALMQKTSDGLWEPAETILVRQSDGSFRGMDRTGTATSQQFTYKEVEGLGH